MSFLPRFVTVLCLLQFLSITMGYLLTHVILRIVERSFGDTNDGPGFPALARFVRSSGLWFYLVPVVWCAMAALRAKGRNELASIPHITFGHAIAGTVLTVALALFFSLGAVSAVTVLMGCR